jgi:hypothetical protein
MDKKQKDAYATSTHGSNSKDTSADAASADAQGANAAGYRSGRNQILVTAALLYPDAEFQVSLLYSLFFIPTLFGAFAFLMRAARCFLCIMYSTCPLIYKGTLRWSSLTIFMCCHRRKQVVLNSTFPLLGNPSVLPAGGVDARLGRSSLSGGKKPFPSRPDGSESAGKGTEEGEADQGGEKTQGSEGAHRAVENILPRALSELDVKRLAWAVGRVRELMAVMLQRGEVVWELSPGIKVLSDLPGGGSNSSHTGDTSGPLSEWVGVRTAYV